MFLKVNASEDVLSVLLSVTRKAYRKRAWNYLERQSFLSEVSDEQRNLICEMTLLRDQFGQEDSPLSGVLVDDDCNILYYTSDRTDVQIREK